MNSAYIDSLNVNKEAEFKTTFFTEVGRLDDNVKDETKRKWSDMALKMFPDIMRINIVVLAMAFIIRMRMNADKPEDEVKHLEDLITEYASLYSKRVANISTDIYKYYRRITRVV